MKRIVLASIAIFIVCALISTGLFFLLSHFFIVSPQNQFNEGLRILTENKEIYESDFEQVYFADNYSIAPEGNVISVTFKENNCKLICYYTQAKEFVDFEIVGPPMFTDDTNYIYVRVLIGIMAVCVALLITIVLEYLSLFLISSKHPYFFEELSDKEQQFLLFLFTDKYKKRRH